MPTSTAIIRTISRLRPAAERRASQSLLLHLRDRVRLGYSSTFVLTPNQWQHVAVVKTAKQLRVYLDGMVADSQAVDRPLRSAPRLHARSRHRRAARWFQARSMRYECGRRRGRLSPCCPRRSSRALRENRYAGPCLLRALEPLSLPAWNTVTFAFDPERVPASIETVTLSFDCRDSRGRELPFSRRSSAPGGGVPGQRRDSGAARVLPAHPPPAISVGGQSRSLTPGVFSCLVLEPRAAGRAPPSEDRAVQLSRTRSLPGRRRWSFRWTASGCWHDPQNQGREQQWWQGPVPEASRPSALDHQDAFPGYHGVAWYWRECQCPPTRTRRSHPAAVLGGRLQGEFGSTACRWVATRAARPVRAGRHRPRARRCGQPPRRARAQPHSPAIDGMTLNQTPRRAKTIPYSAGRPTTTAGS